MREIFRYLREIFTILVILENDFDVFDVFDVWGRQCRITHWAESKHRFQNSWSTKTPFVFFMVIKNIQKYYAWKTSFTIHTTSPLPNSTTNNNNDNNNSIMSDNRSMDEVNRELDDIFLLQWMSTLAAHPPVVHGCVTTGLTGMSMLLS